MISVAHAWHDGVAYGPRYLEWEYLAILAAFAFYLWVIWRIDRAIEKKKEEEWFE